MADNFSGMMTQLDSPLQRGFAITPSDSTDLDTSTRAVYVGGAGDLVALLVGDSASVTFKNAEGLLPVRVKRVLATNTTATSILGLY